MKRIIFLALIAILMTSCYGLDNENFKTLAGMTIGSDVKVLNVNMGEELIFDPQISSDNNQPIIYEWSTQTFNAGKVASTTLISTEPDIRYIFRKLGTYYLRLRADNGEKIIFNDYRVNVNSGFDEGIMILSNDNTDKSSVVFIKTRTQAEIAANEQEIFSDVISLINPSIDIRKATDFHTNYRTIGDITYCPLTITAADDEGSVYIFDRRTFALIKVLNMHEIAPAVKPLRIAGDYGAASAFAFYVLASDGYMYRYDAMIHKLIFKESGLNINRTYTGRYNNTYSPFFSSQTEMYAFNGGTVRTYGVDAGENVVNFVQPYGAGKLTVITRNPADMTKIYLRAGNATFGSKTFVEKTVVPATLCLDESSQMVVNSVNTDVYYNFNDKVYRWNFLNNADFPTEPVTTLPVGEQIKLMGVNNTLDRLYVATYNSSRAGKKGSLYIYKFSDHTLDKKYEGICDNPVSIRYKERIQ